MFNFQIFVEPSMVKKNLSLKTYQKNKKKVNNLKPINKSISENVPKKRLQVPEDSL